MRKDFRRISLKAISLILTVIMVFSVIPVNTGMLLKSSAAVTRNGEERTVVIACSDYQFPNSGNADISSQYTAVIGNLTGDAGSHAVVENILGKMAADGITEADGVLHCGDFDHDLPTQGTTGIVSFRDAISDVVNSDYTNVVAIMGNHDQSTNQYFTTTGNHDPSSGKYGVYAINEDDFPWQGKTSAAEATVKTTAQNLRDYLNSKIAVNYTAPIFIISHLPLHYSMRSRQDGDGTYTNYLFDVINDAGAQGLNIIYLFGHDHSRGWDDYLGGAQIFLAKGDPIYVAQSSQTVFNKETLNFIYMNAGYTGYYQDANYDGNSPSIDLTMTEFEIGENDVVINRYSLLKNGTTDLKASGKLNVQNSYYNGNKNGTDVEGTQKAANVNEYFSANTATVASGYTLTLTDVVDTEYEIPRVIPLEGSGSGTTIDDTLYEDGKNGFYKYTPSTSGQILEEGDYILYGANKGTVLMSTKNSSGGLNGSTQYTITGDQIASSTAAVVNVTVADASSSTYYFKVNGNYLTIPSSGSGISLGTTETALKVAVSSSDSGKVTIKHADSARYLYTYSNSRWYGSSSGTDGQAQITLYKKTSLHGNGDWTPVHYSDEVAPIITTYALPEDGTYALVGANGILEATSSVSSQDSSVKGKPSDEQTLWTLTTESGGYTLKTKIGTTDYYLKNDGSVSTSWQCVTLTADANSKLHIGSLTDAFAVYKATTTDVPASTTHVYTLDTDGIDAGEKYLIVAPSNDYALTLNSSYEAQRTSVTISDNKITMNSDAYDWVLSGKSSGSVKWDAADRYLRTNNNSIGTATSSSNSSFTFSNQGSGNYRLYFTRSGSTYYLRYSNRSFSYNTAENNVRLFKYTPTIVEAHTDYAYDDAWTTTSQQTGGDPIVDQWAMLEPSHAIMVGPETAAESLAGLILASDEFNAYLGFSSTGDNATALPASGITFDTSKYDGTTPGLYEVPVYYNDIAIGYVVVQVLSASDIQSITLVQNEGTVYVGAAKGALTGAALTVTYAGGATSEIPITVGMLIDETGNFNCAQLYCKETGDYEGLGVYYAGNWYSGFTLHVVERNNYPEYPDEGSIRVDKKAWADNFTANGVAQVELTATGVPLDPGIDIAIILDTSSSMGYSLGTYNGDPVYYDGTTNWYDANGNVLSGVSDSNVSNKTTRLDVMQQSLRVLLDNLNVQGANGKTRDITVAIADFNGYTINDTNGKDVDKLNESNQAGTGSDKSVVFTGSKALDADAFVQASTLDSAHFDVTKIVKQSGTNYDRAMEEAYQLLAAKKAVNDANQENRIMYCIFMSDGCPFQYNYFGASSSTSNTTTYPDNPWNDWLTGKYEDTSGFNVPSGAHTYFYNGLGNKHRMAEAIKGSPDEKYLVIRPDANVSYNGQQYMQQVDGLGAKMYTIGFCLTPDKQMLVDTMTTVITGMASAPEYYYPANFAEQLTDAFYKILNDLKQAATEAFFVDNMGAAFDLQMASEYTKNGKEYTLDPAPSIEVISHAVYTHMDYVNGVINDEDRIGERTGQSTTLEKVTFNTSGTEAYSDQLGADNNIFVDGLIDAKTFVYNTTSAAVMIDTDDDGVADYELAPETFYWKIGIVAETEYSLKYYVYLTGSMEGTREAGSYATNEAAILYYMNYLDVPCEKPTVSPRLPWLAANVSYEFYLVNTDGQPVNNAGVVVPFANRVLVGNIQSKEVLLNNTDTTEAFVAANLELPEGYTLYSEGARYTIVIDSETDKSYAEIEDDVNVKGKNTVTTYFYDAKGNWNTAGTVGNVSDYGNTHVAFGVLLVPSLIPDAVVIDYGLPVNISVLANDLSIAVGTEINAISTEIAVDTVLNKQKYDASRLSGGKELTLANGTATVIGGTVRYTPTAAKMQTEETFYYEVILGGKYYYSTVTVYPAQNIYYEDSFFTFTPEEDWETVGETYADKYQAEDRPGEFNLAKIDFNNVYGYDQAYSDTTVTYSLGSARKATVAPGSDIPTAEFTFAGTGFDLFGVTSTTTGAMFVEVYDSTNKRVKNYFVNTFYGYTYNAEEDKFEVAGNGEDGLFQVPVIRSRDLPYGVYNVKVIPRYAASFDKTGNGEYDIYVDGIRIYDPAGKTEDLTDGIADAYDADKEYNDVYVELRSNIISEASFYKLSDKDILADYTPGAMYIDGIAALNSGDEKDAYGKFSEAGPNNELYLSKGQAVAFYLQIDKCEQAPESVQLGMKVVGGNNAGGSLLVMNSAQEKPFTVAVNGAAARYKDVSGAITWNPALVAGTSTTGLKTADASAFVKDPDKEDMSAYEWTLTKSGNNWMIGNGTNNIALTATENTGVSASFAPGGTGDMFTISGEKGVFTFTDTSKSLYLYSVNGEVTTSGTGTGSGSGAGVGQASSTASTVKTVSLITGSSISEENFALYKKTSDGYEKVDAVSELESGGYVIVALGNGGKIVCPATETVTNKAGTYRTLYPIVVVNNSDNIIALTNFKFAFERKEESPEEPVAMLMSAPPARMLAMSAIKDFVLTDYVEDPEVDTSGITVEWADDDLDFGDVATVYIRTPADIAAVTVDDVNVTDVTDNGDGTKTWTYTFTVEQNSDGTYDIVFMDANGTVCKTLATSELELPEVTEPSTETPDEPDDPDEGEGEGEDGKSEGWLRRLVNRIIEFFKKLVRWWKNLI